MDNVCISSPLELTRRDGTLQHLLNGSHRVKRLEQHTENMYSCTDYGGEESVFIQYLNGSWTCKFIDCDAVMAVTESNAWRNTQRTRVVAQTTVKLVLLFNIIINSSWT